MITKIMIAFLLFLWYHINRVRKMEKNKNEKNTDIEVESAPDHACYRDWHKALPEKETRTVDILSDGILRQKDYSLLFEREATASCGRRIIPCCLSGRIRVNVRRHRVIFPS